MSRTKFMDRVQPHVIKEIVEFCQERHGNQLVSIWCGIGGEGQNPNFQVELKGGRKFAYKGATKEMDFGVVYNSKKLAIIWPIL